MTRLLCFLLRRHIWVPGVNRPGLHYCRRCTTMPLELLL